MYMARELKEGPVFSRIEDPAGGGPLLLQDRRHHGHCQQANPSAANGQSVQQSTAQDHGRGGAEFVGIPSPTLFLQRRMLEWFNFTPDELQDAIDTAEAYSTEFSDLVISTRRTDSTHSNGVLISLQQKLLNYTKKHSGLRV